MVNTSLHFKSLLRIVPSVVSDIIHHMHIDFRPNCKPCCRVSLDEIQVGTCADKRDITHIWEINNTFILQADEIISLYTALEELYEYDFGICELQFLKNRLFCKRRTYAPVCDIDVTHTFPVIARRQTRALR